MARYHPPEVLAAADDLNCSRERLHAAGLAAWGAFLADFAPHYGALRGAAAAMAELDALRSLALVAAGDGYARPELNADEAPFELTIEGGRHPLLDRLLGPAFVPTDTSLRAEGARCCFITGPNMGGKSVYTRQARPTRPTNPPHPTPPHPTAL